MAESAKIRIFAPYEWMIAWRYIRPRRAQGYTAIISILSLLGIMIGVAALIIVMSVMNGFRHEILKNILGLNGHVTVQAEQGYLPDYDAVARRLRAVPGVTRAAPVISGYVMASGNGINAGVAVRGMRVGDLRSLTTVSSTLSPGALTQFTRPDSVIIGSGLAATLHVGPGDAITLLAPKGDVTPFGTTPRIKSYQVAGTFKIGMTQYDSSFVFMPLDEAQLFFDYGDQVTWIETMVTDPDRAEALLPAIARAAGTGRVIPWQDTNGSFVQVLEVERNTMFLILSLIILVAALNIISGLIMLVKDKSSDIAILRTMGATRGAVMRVFFIAGASIGVTGTLLGFILGVVFCANIEAIRQGLSKLTGTTLFDPTWYFLSKMPAEMDPTEVTSVVVMALVLSFLATLYPSWRAARLDPVEALRNG